MRNTKRTWLVAAAAVALVGLGGTGVALAADNGANPAPASGSQPASTDLPLAPQQPLTCIDDDPFDDADDRFDDADDRFDDCDDQFGADDQFDHRFDDRDDHLDDRFDDDADDGLDDRFDD
ncbi:ATPase [Saccharopolyspora sp. K220]|uniref:ATPase n=1 Tax=Saccharopolyspora soli TaxID=2926618 RepID=UPI001F58C62E|nr:ATPase [Saccharopolyspora soli]MCI2419650.1 ATPase [Saccharopolyspora soli]